MKVTSARTNTVHAQALPTCLRFQRTFRARIGLFGHLQTKCNNNPTIPTSTSNSANLPSDSPTLTPGINSITPTIIETTSEYLSPGTSTITTAATTISDVDSLLKCPHCDHEFPSRIGHRTETGEPVPGTPTHSRGRRLHCPHCPQAFTYRTGLFVHMRIHDSGIHRNANNTNTPCTPSAPAIHTATTNATTTNDIPPAPPDVSNPHCTRNFNSRISLVGHLRAHRTVNQCLGLRHTVDAPASTALAHLHTARAY
ncbi:unnamed protein product [Schistocephalus solidus]|uniref:C2H2-type domain-containing protein n=1 Tax=Schistocephalus solidus TaxID=70667 RepID=A0A183SX74_SCHSO|nr:unnamed protein product [Schistocephalus solidus]